MKFVKMALEQQQKPISKLLTEKEAATWLGVSVYTLQRIRKRREIGFTKIGSVARYTVEDLQSYVTNKSSKPCPKTASKSEPTTSLGTKTPQYGKPLGLTPIPDKQSALVD